MVIGLKVRQNQPQSSIFGLKVRSRTGDWLPNELAFRYTLQQELEIRPVGVFALPKRVVLPCLRLGYGKDFFLGQPFGQQKSQILVKIGNMR